MATFNEKDHPREEDGKFAPKGEGKTSASSKDKFMSSVEHHGLDTQKQANSPDKLAKQVDSWSKSPKEMNYEIPTDEEIESTIKVTQGSYDKESYKVKIGGGDYEQIINIRGADSMEDAKNKALNEYKNGLKETFDRQKKLDEPVKLKLGGGMKTIDTSKQDEVLDEYGHPTETGVNEMVEFLKEKGIKDRSEVRGDLWHQLCKEVQNRYNLKDIYDAHNLLGESLTYFGEDKVSNDKMPF